MAAEILLNCPDCGHSWQLHAGVCMSHACKCRNFVQTEMGGIPPQILWVTWLRPNGDGAYTIIDPQPIPEVVQPPKPPYTGPGGETAADQEGRKYEDSGRFGGPPPIGLIIPPER